MGLLPGIPLPKVIFLVYSCRSISNNKYLSKTAYALGTVLAVGTLTKNEDIMERSVTASAVLEKRLGLCIPSVCMRRSYQVHMSLGK